MEVTQCPCCLRKVRSTDMTIHHYIPVCRGGTLHETIILCKTCHEVLHYVISIDDVENYKTVDALKHHSIFSAYIKWIDTITHPGYIGVKRCYKAWSILADSKSLPLAD